MARIVPAGVGRRREVLPASCRELRPPVRAVRTDGQRCTSWWSRITPHGPRPQAPTWRRHACVSRCGSVDGMPVHAARRLPLTSRPRSLPRRLSTTCSQDRCDSPRAVLSSYFFRETARIPESAESAACLPTCVAIDHRSPVRFLWSWSRCSRRRAARHSHRLGAAVVFLSRLRVQNCKFGEGVGSPTSWGRRQVTLSLPPNNPFLPLSCRLHFSSPGFTSAAL